MNTTIIFNNVTKKHQIKFLDLILLNGCITKFKFYNRKRKYYWNYCWGKWSNGEKHDLIFYPNGYTFNKMVIKLASDYCNIEGE